MADGYAWLVRALRAFPDLGDVPDGNEDWPTAQRRLLDALWTAATDDSSLPCAPRDLVPLVRQFALAEDREPTLIVATHRVMPNAQEWEEGGCECVAVGRAFSLRVSEWTPKWLDGATAEPPARAACEGEHPGLRPAVSPQDPADPFYRGATGNAAYRTAGQRVGIQTVLAARPGSTIIANLPTRTGKSRLAFVPAILSAGRATAVVVVPTTALAVDQERQFLDLQSPLARSAPTVLAFHSGLSETHRDEIKRRIRDGTQTILFTSPESLVDALRSALMDAAEQGRIALFAVDEAHTVSAWGDDFRPEFLQLGAMRRMLLDASPKPFTTLLMTGTLTAQTLDALVVLFNSPIGLHVVSSVDLRSETLVLDRTKRS